LEGVGGVERFFIKHYLCIEAIMKNLLHVLLEVTYPEGTVRDWKNGPVKKHNGKWYPVESGKVTADPLKTPHKALKEAIRKGVLEPAYGKHLENARAFLADHKEQLGRFGNALKELSPEGADVKFRVKDLPSTLGKMVRKPKSYSDPRNLQDGTGGRIILSTVDDVKSTVENIRKTMKVLGEDDYISTPQMGGYRSHHLIVEHEGLAKEIQVRTARQNEFAGKGHLIYKPHTPEQFDAVEKHGKEINDFMTAQSEHFYRLDQGKASKGPKCPEVVKNVFGCFSE